MSEYVSRYVENITVPEHRLRTLNADALDRMTESFRRLGQRTPITVRETDDDVILVAGLHRLEAARRLGWEKIDAVVCSGDEADARLWEIAENLHRADLSEAERRQHIAEWVRLTDDKVRHGAAPLLGGAQPADQGIRKAARELGVDERSVRRAVAAESLPEPVKAAADAAGLGTVKRAEVAREPTPEAQAAKVREFAERKPVKPAPLPLNDIETEEQWITAIMRVWNRGAPQWRERFLGEVDTAAFDRTEMGSAA